MALARIGFFANLALVIITSCIITTYLFKSSDNQCQMTFMMEPPKFIPIPIEGSAGHAELGMTGIDTGDEKNSNRNYRLFMYSEFGFPLISDDRRDLKDSMPVLFVPGNAGSYQQVRSLASTCIRRHIQSLDAYKFVFYTIDFRDQLSGISGELIEDQIMFVVKAINQITSMHPLDTNGIVIVSHSVGGFITKALFTKQGFDPENVPLLINLASPLTKPFLNFDTKMRDLYRETNNYWSKQSHASKTISISISGGKSDRLVPMHLSLDHHYDLSLTTSSIRDVWLATDHVCITWCRELMHKLAHLLSALMDRKQTRLISDKNKALSIIKNELLTDSIKYNRKYPCVIQKQSRITKPHIIKNIVGFYSATRNQLIDELIIINSTECEQKTDYLLWIEHIEHLKENGIYGCKTVDISDKNSVVCNDKTDLISSSKTIPSRGFEPKKTVITLDSNILSDLNYILLDFPSSSRENQLVNKVPESVSIIPTKVNQYNTLYVPNIIEYLANKIISIFFKSHVTIIDHKRLPLAFVRYRLENLIYSTQYYSAFVESKNCALGDHAREGLASIYQGKHLIESFHPDKNTRKITIKLCSHRSLIDKSKDSHMEERTLELFLDGQCDNSLHLKLDMWALIENIIQVHLSRILTCSTYFAYATIIWTVSNLEAMDSKVLQNSYHGTTIWLLGGISVYLSCSMSWLDEHSAVVPGFGNYSDEIVQFALICFLSNGSIAFLQYTFKRIVDLATITNNLQSSIRSKITLSRSNNNTVNSNGSGSGINEVKKGNSNTHNSFKKSDKIAQQNNTHNDGISKHKPLGYYYDWVLVVLALLGSVVLSEALMSVCMLLIIIKAAVALNAAYYRTQDGTSEASTSAQMTNRFCCKQQQVPKTQQLKLYEVSFDLLVGMAALCTLSMLSNIPGALLRLNTNAGWPSISIDGSLSKETPIASIISLMLVKFTCEYMGPLAMAERPSSGQSTNFRQADMINSVIARASIDLSSRCLPLLTLIPIALIETDVRHINLVLLIILIWINIRLHHTTMTIQGEDNDETQRTKASKCNKVN